MERDSETRNDHTMFRYYESSLGRWLSPDPLGGDITNPQSLNRYAYALNNPANLTDKTGLAPGDGPRHTFQDVSSGLGGCETPNDACVYVDGEAVSGMALVGMLNMGQAAVCPESCLQTTWDSNTGSWVLQQYWAFANGGGYFSVEPGAGALFYSLVAAGTAGALAAQNASAGDPVMREYGTYVYGDTADGVYSYADLQEGPPCNPSVGCEIAIDTSGAPDGMTVVGLGHDHPGTFYGSYSFSFVDEDTYIKGDYYGFLATQPAGRVLMFDPNLYNNFFQHGPQLLPECVLSGPLMGMSSCH